MLAILIAPLLVPVDTNNPVFLASAQVKHSGVHLGAGVFLGANHNPKPGGTTNLRLAQGLNAQSKRVKAREIDFTLPEDTSQWRRYGASPTERMFVHQAYDMALEIAPPMDGEAIPMAVFSDPSEMAGNVINVGFPVINPLTQERKAKPERQMFYSESTLKPGKYFPHDFGGGLIGNEGWVSQGMSGGGLFLAVDPDQDGQETYALIGLTTRPLSATAVAPFYPKIAGILEELGYKPDDFPRQILISGQTEGSSQTTVSGTFFHEDIYGGPNPDRLEGGAGNDRIFAGAGADHLVFSPGGGQDEILDFQPGIDRIEIIGIPASDLTLSQQGADVAITYGPGADRILITNASLASIEDALDR